MLKSPMELCRRILPIKNMGISSEPEFTTDDFAKNRQAWPRIPRKNAL
jgi:hypothetical protein